MPGYHDPVQHRRLSSFSINTIENYFAHLNPIAKRIAFDINDTKANYGKLWDTLNYQEQNDIINDTLIKPEISLRYFDNFLTPTPTNSSGNSCQSSTDSLTAIVLKDVNTSRKAEEEPESDKKKNIGIKSYGTKSAKSCYSYDGRNLHTFGLQNVSLKVIQDDVLGCFRDEHSRPFSYRTKSQINLFILRPILEPGITDKAIVLNKRGFIIETHLKSPVLISGNECTIVNKESKKTLNNYQCLQRQLNINLNEKKLINFPANQKDIKSSGMSLENKVYNLTTNLKNCKNTKSSLIENYINSTQINETPKMDDNYADAYCSMEESYNLLQHCGRSYLTSASCSSAATSDDDEKTLEAEDVYLLDNDSNIRRGFDFLNNW